MITDFQLFLTAQALTKDVFKHSIKQSTKMQHLIHSSDKYYINATSRSDIINANSGLKCYWF